VLANSADVSKGSESSGTATNVAYSRARLRIYAVTELISSGLRMKLGMVGCEVRRKTLIASSLIEGIRLMSTKLGAEGFLLGGEVALI
jgi:hypothetical protein